MSDDPPSQDPEGDSAYSIGEEVQVERNVPTLEAVADSAADGTAENFVTGTNRADNLAPAGNLLNTDYIQNFFLGSMAGTQNGYEQGYAHGASKKSGEQPSDASSTGFVDSSKSEAYGQGYAQGLALGYANGYAAALSHSDWVLRKA